MKLVRGVCGDGWVVEDETVDYRGMEKVLNYVMNP